MTSNEYLAKVKKTCYGHLAFGKDVSIPSFEMFASRAEEGKLRAAET